VVCQFKFNMLLMFQIACDSWWTCLSGAWGDERKCARQRAELMGEVSCVTIVYKREIASDPGSKESESLNGVKYFTND
jgi:hypothetical protein